MTTLISAERIVGIPGGPADALLVDDGAIVALGTRSHLVADADVMIHHEGHFIIPGLRDAHLHAVPYAALLDGCSLKSATSIDDLIARLRTHASTVPMDQPVVATRFDDEHLAERRLPGRFDLDRAVPDRPAVIYRYCGHVAVANSHALAGSAIGASTPDPDGGSIDRSPDGEPTGVLRETAAGLVAPTMARGGTVTEDQLIDTLEGLAGLGLTSIGAMMGYGEQPSEKLGAEVDLWCSVAERLPIRVHGITITDDPHQLREAASALNTAGPRLRWLGVKRFADGSLGGHTAAMEEPFADVGGRGTFRLTQVDTDVCATALDLGGMVCVHAIGDRAVAGALDLFDLLMSTGANPGDLRVEHASVASPELIDRLAASGVIASVQPAFLASESEWVLGRVGARRGSWLYPFRSMLAAGVPLSGSSDCPVEPPNPLAGVAAAVDRHGIVPSEALETDAALDLFTFGAARALREPQPLTEGSMADFVVVDRDITAVSADEIRAARIETTYVGGAPCIVDRDRPTWID